MSIIISQMSKADIKSIVDVHMKSFPDFFLTFLGPSFLKEFYGSFLIDKEGVGFVAKSSENQNVIGVIVGPVIPDGYFKRLLKRRWWAFCLASISAVIKKPTVIKRLFRAVFYRGQAPEGNPRSLLSSLAVDPDIQGKGVGRMLVSHWIQEVQKRGSKGCFLTTDAEGNEGVNAFYQKLGWQVESNYTTPEGRRMNRYVLDFV
jgi:colanic acid biosynthesis glycosyl transferase WcaI